MLTVEQIKMARAALGWSVEQYPKKVWLGRERYTELKLKWVSLMLQQLI